VPVAMLAPNTHLRLKYSTPPRGGNIEYLVEANHPVDTFVLDEGGLKEFNTGDKFIYSYYGGFSNRKLHQQELKLPFKGTWYLIIKNSDKNNPVAVHYEVEGYGAGV
jgi:hypothetical protein